MDMDATTFGMKRLAGRHILVCVRDRGQSVAMDRRKDTDCQVECRRIGLFNKEAEPSSETRKAAAGSFHGGSRMLVLSRHVNETIMIGDDIEIRLIDVRGDKARIGIEAPTDVPVHRREVWEAIKRDGQEKDSK